MYFRARYYDPAIGEFNSKDAFNYGDGMSLFRGYLGLLFNDPSGNSILISLVAGGIRTADCGAFSAYFEFSLPGFAPCEGYLIQEIEIREAINSCDNCPLPFGPIQTHVKHHFWEAWHMDIFDQIPASDFNFTDE